MQLLLVNAATYVEDSWEASTGPLPVIDVARFSEGWLLAVQCRGGGSLGDRFLEGVAKVGRVRRPPLAPLNRTTSSLIKQQSSGNLGAQADASSCMHIPPKTGTYLLLVPYVQSTRQCSGITSLTEASGQASMAATGDYFK